MHLKVYPVESIFTTRAMRRWFTPDFSFDIKERGWSDDWYAGLILPHKTQTINSVLVRKKVDFPDVIRSGIIYQGRMNVRAWMVEPGYIAMEDGQVYFLFTYGSIEHLLMPYAGSGLSMHERFSLLLL